MDNKIIPIEDFGEDVVEQVQPYKVLVRVDDAWRVVAINSSAFITDTVGWVEIDSGWGDKYHHAQGNYLPGPLMDERGILRYMASPVAEWPEREALHRFEYKGTEWAIYERTQEEMDADYTPPEQKPTTEQRVDALETTTDDIILMLADMIGG